MLSRFSAKRGSVTDVRGNIPGMRCCLVAIGGLLCGTSLACGERSGDPVVAGMVGGGAGGTKPGGPPMMADGGAGLGPGVVEAAPGPTGLCGGCTSNDACGDADDLCLEGLDGVGFCGRDCGEGCPAGYQCADVEGSLIQQCVPDSVCATARSPVPPLDFIRQTVLERVNADRTAQGIEPLMASPCLDELAQASALALGRTGEIGALFERACKPSQTDCACGWSAETEFTIAAFGLDWTTVLEHLFADRPATSVERDNDIELGVGFWLSGDEAWVALSYR